MKNLTEFLKYFMRNRFLTDYCGFDITSGINHWINNKGTSPNSKKTALDDADKAKIKDGWEKIKDEGNQVMDNL